MSAKQPKQPKAPPIPRQQTFSRINFLYQASHLLAVTTGNTTTSSKKVTITHKSPNPLSNFYSSHLRTLARRSVLRLDPSMKRTICKRCEALLIPGVSAEHRIENKSKGGKKKHSDILVVEYKGCGALKRFPIGQREDYKLWSENGRNVGKRKTQDVTARVKEREIGRFVGWKNWAECDNCF